MERDEKREPFAPILEMFAFSTMWIISFLWSRLNFIYLLYCYILASIYSISDICVFPFYAQYFSKGLQISASLRTYFRLSMSTMRRFRFSVWWYEVIGITLFSIIWLPIFCWVYIYIETKWRSINITIINAKVLVWIEKRIGRIESSHTSTRCQIQKNMYRTVFILYMNVLSDWVVSIFVQTTVFLSFCLAM